MYDNAVVLFAWTEVAEGIPEFKSNREEVLEGPRQMVERVVDRSVRASNISVINPKRDRIASIGRVGSVSRDREQQCYRCGKQGHKKSECWWALGVCFACGQMGHIVSERKKDRDIKCYRCGQVGHIASGCRGIHINVVCGNCGKNGHYARMCKEQCAKCAECGMEGHIASVCK
ncbi:uncharacterized protein LOC135225403 [Macrobrachium nipponense]|uniref:uncharacterized protein LOC135225403 n=1 Tax=Macrobrachium nipponense TaxID=159736 RepID=UPI0030C84217